MTPFMASDPKGVTVLVDAENVRRSRWPNLSRGELVEAVRDWAGETGHPVLIVFDGAAPEEAPDLEDAVAPADKTDATRALVVEVVRAGAAAPTVAIRINGVRTRWWRDDLAAAAVARPDCVVIPKVESPDDVGAVAALLPDGIGIEVQI